MDMGVTENVSKLPPPKTNEEIGVEGEDEGNDHEMEFEKTLISSRTDYDFTEHVWNFVTCKFKFILNYPT
jgi:hypothetical protein